MISFGNELMIVLNLLGVLGIFNVFLGGTQFTPSPPLFHSLTHEWAGLIGQARGRWFQAQWTLLVPLVLYLLLLLTFYLLSLTAEEYYHSKYRRPRHI